MLYDLFWPMRGAFSPFRLFQYQSFRAAGAAVTALLIAFVVGPMIIRWLQHMQVHQVVRSGTPDSHAGKGTTPTMGGFIILAAMIVPTLLWMRTNNPYVWIALLSTLWMGAIGFLDDYLKLRQKRAGLKNEGLVERWKLAGQITLGVGLAWYLWQNPLSPQLPGASTTVPFFKNILVVPATVGLAWVYVPFVTFVMTAISNSVNLADGLDGLAAGLVAIAIGAFAVFAYVMGRADYSTFLGLYYLRGAGELTIFCTAIMGACIGFLWFNAKPAQVFMGDTGALALGGAIGAVAVLLKSEFLFVFIGGVFVAETASVLVQRLVFKYRKKRYGLEYAQANRVFLKAPLHHHFEMKGWPESQVVVRFWILGILCAFIGLATLKLR
jgi:phospho-N-acetylmuramoyl-pentapeptide-transferase